MKQFLSLRDLSSAEIDSLLANAKGLETNADRSRLEGKVLGLLFMNPSVRTLASFQSAMARLGGSSFVIAPGQNSWDMEWRRDCTMDGDAAEHFKEAIPVLEEYCDALALRCFAAGDHLDEDLCDPIINTVASLSKKPLINLESAMDHPCQALADWKTMDDLGIGRGKTKFVLSWADHPKALPLAVPVATLDMALRRGMDVTILTPRGFELPQSVMASAAVLAAGTGSVLHETNDQSEAMDGAQILYAKSWQSTVAYGDPEYEAELRACARQEDWQVRESWFDVALSDARLMHCLPVRRNVVVADEVLDGRRSVVTLQARNRLYTQMSVLCHLFPENQE